MITNVFVVNCHLITSLLMYLQGHKDTILYSIVPRKTALSDPYERRTKYPYQQ